MNGTRRSLLNIFGPSAHSLYVALFVVISVGSVAKAQTSPTPSPLASGGAEFIYVAEQPIGYNSPASILKFRADASGSVSPSNTLQLPLGSSGLNFTVDSTGQTYAAISAYFEKSGPIRKLARSAQIVVYEPNASGEAPPQRTITSGAMQYPRGIVVSRSGEIYVSDAAGFIFVFSSAADGHLDPIRTIYGAHTHLSGETTPGSLVLDSAGFLYVAADNSILVFAPDADKDVAPVRIITTTYNVCTLMFDQLAFDDRDNLYVLVRNRQSTSSPRACAVPSIFVFAPTADGDSTPIRTLSALGDGRQSMGAPSSFAVDRAGNIVTVNIPGNIISAFGPESEKNAPPASRITIKELTQHMFPVLALQ
jgi:sugar lactone lactonase YvrE